MATPTPTPTPTPTSGADTLTIHASADVWNGDPEFTLIVDGAQVGGIYDLSALHNSGQWQDIVVSGNFGSGAHQVAIDFINHAESGAYYDPATGAVYNTRQISMSVLSTLTATVTTRARSSATPRCTTPTSSSPPPR
jgi:hypothetical protein